MLDVSHKTSTLRTAIARAEVHALSETIARVERGDIPKGDPLAVAKVAAIQAVKDTARIIPYCHPVPVDYVGVDFEIRESSIVVTVTVKAIYKTGVEMEAMVGAGVASITLYDMLKMIDDTIVISEIKLVEKRGGKSDIERANDPAIARLRAAVIVLSDRVSSGEKRDRSGAIVADKLTNEGITVVESLVLPDDADKLERKLIELCDDARVDLILTCGGTGLARRDVTPEATLRVIERDVSGIAEVIRAYGQTRMPFSMLSRAVAGMRGDTLIVNLPGSPDAVIDALNSVFPSLLHCIATRRDVNAHGDAGYAQSCVENDGERA